MLRWLVRPIVRSHLLHIRYLQSELTDARLRLASERAELWQEIRHERQRAEMAIDQCRAHHQQIGPVTLPPMPATPPYDHVKAELEELVRTKDFQDMGGMSG